MVEMTESINIFPNNYGLLQNMGLFTSVSLTQNIALVERRNGTLVLIPSVPVGGPPNVNTSAKRDLLPLVVPHIPLVDQVLPSDVSGVRAFGTENSLLTLDNLMAEKLLNMSEKHDITLEYLRMGALKGLVVDGDGTTILANLFTSFNVTQVVHDTAFSSGTTDIAARIIGLKRIFEDNLRGETMTGVLVLCSPEYWDALVSHPKVQAAYQYWINQGSNILRDDLRGGFTFQGVTYREYRATASFPDSIGGTVRFIPANEAIAFPLGTRNVFKTYFAPANFNETVNTPGKPKYAKQEERRMGQGWDIWTESNPLPIVTRPDLIFRLTKS